MSTSTGVRYAKDAEVDIAYETVGEGEDLVFVPGFVSHLDLMWDHPPFAALLRTLAANRRVTIFDKRGTGLSSRTLGFGSLAERMDDIRLVMDAAGIQRADFFAISEGGPIAMLFAATFPERVASLCVYGSFVRGLTAPDFAAGVDPDVFEMFAEWLVASWGTGRTLDVAIQHIPDSAELYRSLGRYERGACTPAQVGEIMRNNMSIDIRHLLPTISAPTLVLHTRGDPLVRVGQAEYIAEHVPGAVLHIGEGDFHMSWDTSRLRWLLDELAQFFGRRPETESASSDSEQTSVDAPTRSLATVLITDIVGSTERASRLGDRAWSQHLDEHDRVAALAVREHAGRVVKTTGDGVVAVFDSPSRAVRCATALAGSLGELDLPVRAGLHTGEIELRGNDISGVGVHIAARVNSVAAGGEVWVSRTVRDLVTGSGIALESRGSHALKGFEEPWELYAVGS
jgi:class 3 adenylate cyclase/pimeloyl-ACP methyl ester carboxylesterase